MKNYTCPLCKKDFGPRAKTLEDARAHYKTFMMRLEDLVAHLVKCRKETNGAVGGKGSGP